MKILYIHQYFHTPEEPGGTRSYWISQELIKRGHHVVMVTSTNNKLHKEPGRMNVDGIDVIYIKNEYSQSMSPIQKVWSFVKFMAKSIEAARKEKGVDMLFATSTPLSVGAVVLWLKDIKNIPYVFEVRDLWPEFPIQIGAIKNKLVIKFLQAFERRIYRRAEHVVALSPGMKDGVVAAGKAEAEVSMIPNMSKPDKFYPRERRNEVMEQFGFSNDRFNVIHFGAMGVANALEYIIETAKLAQEQGVDDVKFYFAGTGAVATLNKLQGLVDSYGLKNVVFLGNHNMKMISEIVNCCDLSVVTFRNLPILYTNSPNKLFDSLSAGKPICVNSAGWTKNLVEKENCGFFVDPDNAQSFLDGIVKVKDDKELLKTWGENSRRLSVEVFDKSILSAKVADRIEEAYAKLRK